MILLRASRVLEDSIVILTSDEEEEEEEDSATLEESPYLTPSSSPYDLRRLPQISIQPAGRILPGISVSRPKTTSSSEATTSTRSSS